MRPFHKIINDLKNRLYPICERPAGFGEHQKPARCEAGHGMIPGVRGWRKGARIS
jgi:hypothetical protein